MERKNLAALGLAGALALAACGKSSDNNQDTPNDGCKDCVYHSLVWADEFEGTGQPDPLNWSYNVGAGFNKGANAFLGWGNDELEWYRPEQAVQADGNLVITADYDPDRADVAGRSTKVRSARLVSQGKVSFGPARFEARIKMPSADGSWPAFWLMGDAIDSTYSTSYAPAAEYYDFMASTWPAAGEIDIVEHVNTNGDITQNVFWDKRTELGTWVPNPEESRPSVYGQGFDVTQYHTYAVEWNDVAMYWYVDGVRVKTVGITAANQEEFREGRPFHILLNLAVGGRFPGKGPSLEALASTPWKMYVDYVRVYQ